MKTSAACARPDRWKREDVSQIRQTVLMFKIACKKLDLVLLSCNQSIMHIKTNSFNLIVLTVMNCVTDLNGIFLLQNSDLYCHVSVTGLAIRNTDKRQLYNDVFSSLFTLEFGIFGPTFTFYCKRIRNTALQPFIQ